GPTLTVRLQGRTFAVPSPTPLVATGRVRLRTSPTRIRAGGPRGLGGAPGWPSRTVCAMQGAAPCRTGAWVRRRARVAPTVAAASPPLGSRDAIYERIDHGCAPGVDDLACRISRKNTSWRTSELEPVQIRH